MIQPKYADCIPERNTYSSNRRHASRRRTGYCARMSEQESFFLRQWREFRGVTQDELADAADTSKGYLSQIERGDRPYNRKWLKRFSQALNVRPEQLLSPPPHLSDRASWDAGETEAGYKPPFDIRLMRECIQMAFRVVADRHDDDKAAADAADAAIESYFTYFRLKDEESDAV